MTAVHDGDTIDIEHDGAPVEIRLMGINAPESGECFHDEATERLRGLVEDRTVDWEAAGIDQFGRTLAYLWLDGSAVNLDAVAQGYAIATTAAPEDAHGAGLIEAEESAFAGRAGLWAIDACGATGSIPTITVEVTVDPPGPDDRVVEHEQVKFESASRVDVGGWILRDESSAHRCTLPKGSGLPSGAPLVVTSADPCWDPGGSPVWNNGGDLVLLLDANGRVVVRHRYKGEGER